MPQGKAAGEQCVQLDEALRCRLFGQPQRPPVCAQFGAHPEHCGGSREQALILLAQLEADTAAD